MLPAFEYLKKERHLTDETIRQFHLAYCDGKGNIYSDSDFPDQSLELDYKFFDTALFPVCNVYGGMVGVSGRKLNYKSNADLKYVNTVYQKTDHLYGLSVTLAECIKENKVYVVEGNVDTLMMYQSGVKNVVGMLGSTLSITQLSILSRFVDEVLLVPDGDTAGEKLIERITGRSGKKGLIQKFPKLALSFSHVKLPLFFDPDKFLRERGRDEFFKLEVIKLNSNGRSS
jgi:DNA primase